MSFTRSNIIDVFSDSMCKILTPTELIMGLLKVSCFFNCFIVAFNSVWISDWILSKKIEFFCDLGCERFVSFFWCVYWFELTIYVWKSELVLDCCFLGLDLLLLSLRLSTLFWKSSIWSLNLLISLLILSLRNNSLTWRYLLPGLLHRRSLNLKLRLLRNDRWLNWLCWLLNIGLLRNRLQAFWGLLIAFCSRDITKRLHWRLVSIINVFSIGKAAYFPNSRMTSTSYSKMSVFWIEKVMSCVSVKFSVVDYHRWNHTHRISWKPSSLINKRQIFNIGSPGKDVFWSSDRRITSIRSLMRKSSVDSNIKHVISTSFGQSFTIDQRLLRSSPLT